MAQINFDTQGVEERADIGPIPGGDYLFMVKSSEMKTSQNGGEYLKFVLEVAEGPFKGRKVFPMITFSNANETAERIGRQELAELVRCCGMVFIKDTSELHGKLVKATVGIKQDAGYEPSNKIKKWHKPDADYPAEFDAPASPAKGRPF